VTVPGPVAEASAARLLRATVLAAAAAAVLLVLVVLPAEYGIDPTGAGRATGLYRAPAAEAAPLSVTLEPGEGAEIKAEMNAGERLVFSWTTTGGGVDVDMHGEAVDKAGGDRSYWTGEFQTSGHGALEAPMAGNHGWFWQNLNDGPVTITVKTSGFYRRLFRP
jgi:hypothetical protein